MMRLNDGPDQFEPLYKMNRLGPANAQNLPLPVKFRPVFYDPSLVDEEVKRLGEEEDDLDFDTQSVQEKPSGKVFFKDPLCPPDVELIEQAERNIDAKPSASMKLARNMKANNGHLGTYRNKGICDLMTERKRLLQQQKEQQLLYNKEVNSENAAVALVNDLIQNGFHISPPEVSPVQQQPLQVGLPNMSPGTEKDSQIGPVEENRLVLAMHRELKRVQGSDVMGH